MNEFPFVFVSAEKRTTTQLAAAPPCVKSTEVSARSEKTDELVLLTRRFAETVAVSCAGAAHETLIGAAAAGAASPAENKRRRDEDACQALAIRSPLI
jgi:hypothetical protein